MCNFNDVDVPTPELEAFVHGAMCMTYSGRCLLSNFMAERGANQGNCANSCRWHYTVKLQLKDGTVKDLEINDQNIDMFQFWCFCLCFMVFFFATAKGSMCTVNGWYSMFAIFEWLTLWTGFSFDCLEYLDLYDVSLMLVED